jgi:hypothetical protein
MVFRKIQYRLLRKPVMVIFGLVPQEGLARFNGTAFVVFDKENTPQFKSNDIRALLEDRTGAPLGWHFVRLAAFQGGSFTCFTTLKDCLTTA